MLAACSAQAIPSPPQLSHQFIQVPSRQQDNFEVIIWLDKPEPIQGELVTLIGNLKKNNYYLNGIMMEASWPGEDQDRNMPSCTVPVLYQRGVCYIDTANFAVDETVLVKLKFRYNDLAILGEASFTVKAPSSTNESSR